jgi:hypothetical protein
LSEEVSDPEIPAEIATPTLDSNAVLSEWAPPAETVKVIREHVQVSDPSVILILDRAVKAAELACKQAAAAERASERARQAVAELVPREVPERVESPMLVRPPAGAEGLGAVLWDSGDEYFGQVNARGAMGVGVCKIYHLSRKLSPQQVAYYRGQMWNAQLGTFGVWESDGGLTFAGEWIDERPRVGYMTSSAESEVCKFDLYFGQMLQFGDRVWLPDGRGASYRHRYKELVIGVFRRGVPSKACKVIRLDR